MDSHKIIIKTRGWDDNACLGVSNISSIGAWPNSIGRRPPWYCIVVSPLLKKKLINFQKYIDPIVHGPIFTKQTTDSSLSSSLVQLYYDDGRKMQFNPSTSGDRRALAHYLFAYESKLYISSNLNTDFIFWQHWNIKSSSFFVRKCVLNWIWQKPVIFLSAGIALLSSFFQVFIVLGMHSFAFEAFDDITSRQEE